MLDSRELIVASSPLATRDTIAATSQTRHKTRRKAEQKLFAFGEIYLLVAQQNCDDSKQVSAASFARTQKPSFMIWLATAFAFALHARNKGELRSVVELLFAAQIASKVQIVIASREQNSL